MSKDFISHVFEPFAQEDSCARTSYMGTGLGMAIAKQLTEMMEGNIAVESELDVGTTFTVTIPFIKKHMLWKMLIFQKAFPV